MRSWVAHPLRNVNMITERLDAVQELAVNDGKLKTSLLAPHYPCNKDTPKSTLPHSDVSARICQVKLWFASKSVALWTLKWHLQGRIIA